MRVSNLFIENYNEYRLKQHRIVLNQGGTSSSKTYSILQVLKDIAETSKHHKLISILGPTMPHIRRGSLRDFINILESDNQYSDNNFNKTNLTFQIGNSEIEFFSSDAPEKVRGPRRDILFVNELNLIKKETFEQALIRTKEICYADYNPVRRFYAHDDLMLRSDCRMIKSTFRDNPFLDANIITEVLQRRKNKNWWKVYGEGEVGEVEGLVYETFEVINEIPSGALHLGYGMDFGYTNSKTALIELYSWRDIVILNEVIYQAGLLTKQLTDLMKARNVKTNKRIIADSEDPRLIQEIKNAGFTCQGIKKPKVKQRIDKMKSYPILVTSASLNIITELQNYMWQEYEGAFLEEPIKEFDHALDGAGYAIWELMDKKGLFMF